LIDKVSIVAYLTNRIWFSVVCSSTLIDNDTRHHSSQNVVDSRAFFRARAEKGIA